MSSFLPSYLLNTNWFLSRTWTYDTYTSFKQFSIRFLKALILYDCFYMHPKGHIKYFVCTVITVPFRVTHETRFFRMSPYLDYLLFSCIVHRMHHLYQPLTISRPWKEHPTVLSILTGWSSVCPRTRRKRNNDQIKAKCRIFWWHLGEKILVVFTLEEI